MFGKGERTRRLRTGVSHLGWLLELSYFHYKTRTLLVRHAVTYLLVSGIILLAIPEIIFFTLGIQIVFDVPRNKEEVHTLCSFRDVINGQECVSIVLSLQLHIVSCKKLLQNFIFARITSKLHLIHVSSRQWLLGIQVSGFKILEFTLLLMTGGCFHNKLTPSSF